MNVLQIARLKSFRLVVQEARKKQTTIDQVPTFAAGIDKLEGICDEIVKNWIEQDRNMTGLTADKLKKHTSLSDITLEVSGAVHSYAHGINDQTLMSKVYYTSTTIGDMSQMELLTAAKIVSIEAKKVPPDSLAKEGITAEDLTNLDELIKLYNAAEPTTREAVIGRSGYTEAIRKLFSEATVLFRSSLNRLSVQFKRKDPDFYLKYRAARNVIYNTTPDENTPPTK